MEELGILRTGRGFRPRELKQPKAAARRGRKATKRRAAGKQVEAAAELSASPGDDEPVAETSVDVVTATTTAEPPAIVDGMGNRPAENVLSALGFRPDNHGISPRSQGETRSPLTGLALPLRPGSAWGNYGHSEAARGSQGPPRLPSMQLDPLVGPNQQMGLNRAPYAPMGVDSSFDQPAPVTDANYGQYTSLGRQNRDFASFGQMGESNHASYQREASPSYPVHPSHSAHVETSRFSYHMTEPASNQGHYATFNRLSSNPYTTTQELSRPHFAPLSHTSPDRAPVARMSQPTHIFMSTQQGHRRERFSLSNSLHQRFPALWAASGQSGAPAQARPQQNRVSNAPEMAEASGAASATSEESNGAPCKHMSQRYWGSAFTPINKPAMHSSSANTSPVTMPRVMEYVPAPTLAAVSREPLPAGRDRTAQPLNAAASLLRHPSDEGFSTLNSSSFRGTPSMADSWNTGSLAPRSSNSNNWVPLTPARPSPIPEGVMNPVAANPPVPIKSALASGGNRTAKRVRIQVPQRGIPVPDPTPSTLASTAAAALAISPANPDAHRPADADATPVPGSSALHYWVLEKRQ